jgi:hypothetical protein
MVWVELLKDRIDTLQQAEEFIRERKKLDDKIY